MNLQHAKRARFVILVIRVPRYCSQAVYGEPKALVGEYLRYQRGVLQQRSHKLGCRGIKMHRCLKRLFKLVTSTAYERLVREFYTHLRIDGDQPNILFSSVDGREVVVTIADIAAMLKCSHEPPVSDILWLECPSMLTLEDIISDMCEEQYVDDRQNTASKTKIPWNLLFIDMVLYQKCVSFGTQDTEVGPVPQCPLLIPQRILVFHS
jgi:hypothetical protein